MTDIIVFTDGGARGNPGPAALGVFIKNNKNEILAQIGKYIGETTNNVAEYSAIIEALNWIIKNKDTAGADRIYFYMDSQLAYSQLVGIYKIKNDRIREMMFEIRKKEKEIGTPIYYNHVPRERNKQADALVNLALDNRS